MGIAVDFDNTQAETEPTAKIQVNSVEEADSTVLGVLADETTEEVVLDILKQISEDEMLAIVVATEQSHPEELEKSENTEVLVEEIEQDPEKSSDVLDHDSKSTRVEDDSKPSSDLDHPVFDIDETELGSANQPFIKVVEDATNELPEILVVDESEKPEDQPESLIVTEGDKTDEVLATSVEGDEQVNEDKQTIEVQLEYETELSIDEIQSIEAQSISSDDTREVDVSIDEHQVSDNDVESSGAVSEDDESSQINEDVVSETIDSQTMEELLKSGVICELETVDEPVFDIFVVSQENLEVEDVNFDIVSVSNGVDDIEVDRKPETDESVLVESTSETKTSEEM